MKTVAKFMFYKDDIRFVVVKKIKIFPKKTWPIAVIQNINDCQNFVLQLIKKIFKVNVILNPYHFQNIQKDGLAIKKFIKEKWCKEQNAS